MLSDRRVKIVATIGPATQAPQDLEKAILSGMNVARLNFSHGDHKTHIKNIGWVRQIAAEKGIIVVVAAGNEGNLTWKYIVTPADNEKVFTIGGVDSTGNPSVFTSFGPNSAGKVKPDASARATSTYFAYNNGAYPGNGTSYATPLSAGGIELPSKK